MNRKYQSSSKQPGWIQAVTFWFRFKLLCLGMVQLVAQPALHHLTHDQTGAPFSKSIKGWMLINELGCFQCHSKPPNALKGLPAFDAPNLTEIHARLTPEFIYQFIQIPDHSHPGTRMPSVMNHLTKNQKTEAARHITVFLMQSTINRDQQFTTPRKFQPADANEGRTLFAAIGCAVCHPFQDSNPQKIPDSLKHVRSKYQFEGLLQFLCKPQSVREGFRMPDFNLTEEESKKLASYLMDSKPPTRPTFTSNGESEKGQLLFSQLQCSRCHTISEKEGIPNAFIPIPAPSSLNKGCLSEITGNHSVNYRLSSLQLDLIRSALSQEAASEVTEYQTDLNAYLGILRCNACHERQPLTSPQSVAHTDFTSSGEDLGDEGRIPPTLDGVGRKLTQSALHQTILGEMPVRPYMNTRMPNWGNAHAKVITKQFSKSDIQPDEKPTPRDGQENQVGRNMWGRALVGIEGLGCIQCHPLNGNRSLGIQAMDLKHSGKRLRAPWFRDYLLNPAKFRPGTRMPSFWPNGKPSISGHGGSTERQIDSIWAYLNELDQSRLPKGMESKGNFKLTPETQPLVFRTFMEEAGLHAIAVGFPQNFHVAFDSKSCRWVIAWNGAFLDAEATWDDRFTPLTKPLGNKLPWFPQSNSIWEQSDSSNGNQNLNIAAEFSGYL
jgi:cytochrome c2